MVISSPQKYRVNHPKQVPCVNIYHIGVILSFQNIDDYIDSLPADAHPYLDKVLDWDVSRKDADRIRIAAEMDGWDRNLAPHLGLTHTNIQDIKEKYPHQELYQR